MLKEYRAEQAQSFRFEEQQERCARMSRHNLWEVVLFLVISILAYSIRDLNLFMLASEPLRQLLGYPPPAYLISIALAVYFCSSACLTLTGMAREQSPQQGWNQLFYRGAFYFFYSFSGAIAGNFLPVLLVGLGLYGLDQYHVWFYNAKGGNGEKGLVEKY